MRGWWTVFFGCALVGCGAPAITSYVDSSASFVEDGHVVRTSTRYGNGLEGAYALPRTLFEIDITKETKDNVSTEVFALTKKTEPDPRAKLMYRLEPSATSLDQLEVTTDEFGILASVSADVTDKTGDIIKKVAELVFTVATKGASLPAEGAKAETTPLDDGLPFKAVFDPLNYGDMLALRKRLLTVGRGYCLLAGAEASTEGCPLQPKTRHLEPDASAKAALDYVNRYPGIFYRRPTSLPVRALRQSAKNVWTSVYVGKELVFDQSELYEIKIDRYAFIQGQTTISFTNGGLTKIKLVKPSEVLAFVSIPVEVLKIAFAIPLAGIKQDTALLQAQTGKLEQEANLVKAQSALVKLQIQQTQQGVVATPQ